MPKPYRLYHGDCLEVLATIPEASVDLIFADPPYNLSNDGFTCKGGKMVSVNKGGWDKSQGFEKDYEFHLAWLEACTGWDYFVNWLKVNEGIRKVEIDLNLLNYLVGKEDIEQEAIKLLREHPKIMQTLPTG